MSSFDFTALIQFLQALFDAFAALMSKFGFSFGAAEEEAPAEEEVKLPD